MSTTIIMIAAASEGNAIGRNNDLLWHLPNDFKRFKKLTTGHPIIMGRKTFESFPKPLPKRTHIVITRDRQYRIEFPECHVVHTLEDALQLVNGKEIAYVIGGGEIYRQAEPYTHMIELTRVHGRFDDADTFFPAIKEDVWQLIKEEFHPKDEKHAYAFSYLTYVRS